MKKLIFAWAAVGCTLFSMALMAQKVKSSMVPANVSKALIKKYPAAAKVTWEKEKGNFEANWGGKSGEDMSVTFTPAGVFVEQVEAIEASALPAAMTTYIKTHYKKAKITEAGKVTNAKGATTYKAGVKGKDLVFDEKGALLR